MFRVPAPPFKAPLDPFADATQLPINVHDWPTARLEEKAAMLRMPPTTPLTAVQVRVIPFVGTNVPPAVTPSADVLLMLDTVVLISTVTVNVLLYTSSALVGSAPVLQTVGSLQLPDLTAKTLAMIIGLSS
jgi:hypothetical protein